ncbi:MAG TPA: hypothetical protein V6C81_27055 [Planktothrix sp.]|jgi:nicotinamidase-related amidase
MKLLIIIAVALVFGIWLRRENRVLAAAAPRRKRTLYIGLCIDMLKCFDDEPEGSLRVLGTHKLLAGVNRLIAKLKFWYMIQDFHPEGHGSFFTQYPGKKFLDTTFLSGIQQVLWYEHAVQGRTGFDSPDFIEGLTTNGYRKLIRKGTDVRVDSYSAFYDNGLDAPASVKAQYPFLGQSTGLWEDSKVLATEEDADEIVFICFGVAGDYCDKFTALHARRHTWKGKPVRVIFVTDLTAYIGDEQATLAELRAAGIECKTLAEVEAELAAAA